MRNAQIQNWLILPLLEGRIQYLKGDVCRARQVRPGAGDHPAGVYSASMGHLHLSGHPQHGK